MAKHKTPKRYFPHPGIASISHRHVTKYDDMGWGRREHFATWGEAHSVLTDRAVKRLNTARKELASAERHLKKVLSMVEPNPGEPQPLADVQEA